jgi:hypothetical protein
MCLFYVDVFVNIWKQWTSKLGRFLEMKWKEKGSKQVLEVFLQYFFRLFKEFHLFLPEISFLFASLSRFGPREGRHGRGSMGLLQTGDSLNESSHPSDSYLTLCRPSHALIPLTPHIFLISHIHLSLSPFTFFYLSHLFIPSHFFISHIYSSLSPLIFIPLTPHIFYLSHSVIQSSHLPHSLTHPSHSLTPRIRIGSHSPTITCILSPFALTHIHPPLALTHIHPPHSLTHPSHSPTITCILSPFALTHIHLPLAFTLPSHSLTFTHLIHSHTPHTHPQSLAFTHIHSPLAFALAHIHPPLALTHPSHSLTPRIHSHSPTITCILSATIRTHSHSYLIRRIHSASPLHALTPRTLSSLAMKECEG